MRPDRIYFAARRRLRRPDVQKGSAFPACPPYLTLRGYASSKHTSDCETRSADDIAGCDRWSESPPMRSVCSASVSTERSNALESRRRVADTLVHSTIAVTPLAESDGPAMRPPTP